jgi:hypothetical protein
MATLEEMKEAVQGGNTKVLTLERAKELLGKRIATICFDMQPKHQHVIDEFTIGEIKSEFELHPDRFQVIKDCKTTPHLLRRMKLTFEIITLDARRTFLQAHTYKNGIFTGPDPDSEVWFKEI